VYIFLSSFHCSSYFHKYNCERYGPVWASLARDYLPIMASLVSSERAFSQGGITISKRQNRLKGDIVEALQCVKCSLQHDLIFHAPAPSSALETELQDDDDELEEDAIDQEGDEEPWDAILDDGEDMIDLDGEDEEDFDADVDSGSDVE
jgi:hypothetical protein